MPIIRKKQKNIKPTRLLVLSFVCAILAGAFLLMLPISATSGQWGNFIDCLFTSTSATCVTGLTVCDTYIHWTIFGQSVIMLLIQIGGLGLITLVTSMSLALGRKMGLVKQSNLVSDISLSGISAMKSLFRRIVAIAFGVELAGAIALMFTFIPEYGAYGVFMSFFMAVSSFCNAGLDVMSIDGKTIADYYSMPQVLIPMMLLIIIGGIGFTVWDNFFSYRKVRKLSFHTKIVLITTAILIVTGTVLYFIVSLIEAEKFAHLNVGEKVMTSAFASVSARTAGFTVADLPLANEFSRLTTMTLMFIGAAPSSTAGGVKVTTLAILVTTIICVLKGREDTVVFGHTISKKVVYKALAVFVLSIGFIVVSFVAVYLLNPELKAMDILYEVISAFSTTGLSSGVSAVANDATKIILTLTMFVGRIGPISLILSLTSGSKPQNADRVLPQGDILIG